MSTLVRHHEKCYGLSPCCQQGEKVPVQALLKSTARLRTSGGVQVWDRFQPLLVGLSRFDSVR